MAGREVDASCIYLPCTAAAAAAAAGAELLKISQRTASMHVLQPINRLSPYLATVLDTSFLPTTQRMLPPTAAYAVVALSKYQLPQFPIVFPLFLLICTFWS